ncbi:hypothetical protein ABZ865_28785 [Streptomyces sp. NPDC047085]|uniref:hypothetical protein n=1 Tax=Streptomyces sp. NPDC047085 TaxID=3155140 RepID=UPI003401E4AF
MRSGVGGGFRRLWRWSGRERDESALAEIEAEITAFGEALNVHPFRPGQPGATDGMRAELARALDAYEQAKRDFAGARMRTDVLDVLRALDEGRHALACLDALLAGRPLPKRMPLCFFDARHGRATEQVSWAPPGGVVRNIAVCAADAVRLAEGSGTIIPGPEPVPDRITRGPSPGTSGTGAGPSGPGPGSGSSGSNGDSTVRARPRRAKPRWATPGTVPQAQVSGEGGGDQLDQLHQLAMPPYHPAVLVLRTSGPAQVHLRLEGGKGRSSRLYRLSGGGSGGGAAPVTARIPLPVKNRSAAFRLSLVADGPESWTATTAPLREVPRFHDRISGAGSDVVHYRGEPGPGILRYTGPSLLQLEALDEGLAYRVTLAEVRAGEHTFQWPGRGYYQVRSAGEWSLSAM